MNNFEYINGFSCAIKDDKSELILAIYRKYPSINESGDFSEEKCDLVNTLIMNKDTAQELRNALDSLLNDNEIIEE